MGHHWPGAQLGSMQIRPSGTVPTSEEHMSTTQTECQASWGSRAWKQTCATRAKNLNVAIQAPPNTTAWHGVFTSGGVARTTFAGAVSVAKVSKTSVCKRISICSVPAHSAATLTCHSTSVRNRQHGLVGSGPHAHRHRRQLVANIGQPYFRNEVRG